MTLQTQYASYYSSSLGPVSVGRVLICKECRKYIASMDNLLSKAYCGAQSSKAGLFDDVSNVALGERQVWLMRSGAHTVRELHCLGCEAYVGFKIVHAHEPTERWKDGAYILERQFLFLHSVYEGDNPSDMQQQWLSPPLRLKVVDDLRQLHKLKKQARMPESNHLPVLKAPVRPLPRAPLPVEAY